MRAVGTDNYLEGFSIHFNATQESYKMDFRQNMCLYCLTNDVILDKTGAGVADIRAHSLRLPCALGESYDLWASATITCVSWSHRCRSIACSVPYAHTSRRAGFKELRYLKFVLRSITKGTPLQTDAAERAFVISSLKAAFTTNADALKGFWFGYALESSLQSAAALQALHDWVCEHGGAGGASGPDWWKSDWVPMVKACAPASTLAAAASELLLRDATVSVAATPATADTRVDRLEGALLDKNRGLPLAEGKRQILASRPRIWRARFLRWCRLRLGVEPASVTF